MNLFILINWKKKSKKNFLVRWWKSMDLWWIQLVRNIFFTYELVLHLFILKQFLNIQVQAMKNITI